MNVDWCQPFLEPYGCSILPTVKTDHLLFLAFLPWIHPESGVFPLYFLQLTFLRTFGESAWLLLQLFHQWSLERPRCKCAWSADQEAWMFMLGFFLLVIGGSTWLWGQDVVWLYLYLVSELVLFCVPQYVRTTEITTKIKSRSSWSL